MEQEKKILHKIKTDIPRKKVLTKSKALHDGRELNIKSMHKALKERGMHYYL